MLQTLRSFFLERGVMEVETPIIGQAATVDPFIDSLQTNVFDKTHYLQTSPEFFLKRLLCAGSGDIYSLGKVFRQGEKGRRHHPEFTMLEWYRVGWDEYQLIDEVVDLLQCFWPKIETTKVTYQSLFEEILGINPHCASEQTLAELSRQHITINIDAADKNTWLDLLMTHCIEPTMPEGLVFVTDYPATQAALAKCEINHAGQLVARRFEAYVNRIELANGYFELNDAVEQQQRFEKDQQFRRDNNLPIYPYDEKLVEAINHGLPDCAGVALGVDRLMMLSKSASSISEVMSFFE